jgi:hypothetical protein
MHGVTFERDAVADIALLPDVGDAFSSGTQRWG